MFVCVVNPVSGRGQGQVLAERLRAELVRRGHACRILLTDPDAEAFRATCAGITAEERVICIGGDGTLLYFLNHAQRFAALAFYGMGTANVITIEFNLPKSVTGFAEMLERGRTRHIYPGRLDDGTRFLMMASVGIDAEVLSRVRQRLKNRFGKFAFLPATFSALWRYGYPRAKLVLDGGEPQHFALAAVCRFRHYGGAFSLAPQADPSVRQFQVIGLRQPGFLGLLRFCLALLSGRPQRFGLYCAAAEKVEVQGQAPAQLDGDYHPSGLHQLEVCQESFPLIVP